MVSDMRCHLHLGLLILLASLALAAEPLRVVATVPELGAIARAVGGDDVVVTVLARPSDDPHRVEARPSFVVELARAELLLSTGFELEIGWLPPLISNARNPRIRKDAGGHIEAATLVAAPIGVAVGPVDRSAGDVHPHGNPHVLLDPAVGLAMAGVTAARMAELRPEAATRFSDRLQAFAQALGTALAGEAIAQQLDVGKLIQLDDHGRLYDFLDQQGLSAQLGGWWGLLHPYADAPLAADHDLYPYLARRFNLRITILLEPKPGVPPSTRHLASVAARMRDGGVRALLATPYFDRKAIELVAGASGARIVDLAHQAGALPGTDTYIAWVDANVRAIAKGLAP
jgi:zinc/manganese transport system substrate-binding protein